ncbi:MAG: hypothetical protein ACLQVN_12745 [Bryobacteraceae bacterium]
MHQLDLAPDESLAARLRKEPLPLALALRLATGIASELRDLHAEGRAHGALELESLRCSRSGISLGEARGGTDKASMRRDIAGYGRILNWMLTGSPEPQAPAGPLKHRSSEALRAQALDHARRCLSGRPGIQRVVTEVRLLSVLARQMPEAAAKGPLPPRSAPNWEVVSVEPANGPGSPPLPAPAGVKCPNCGCTWAHRSCPRTGLDALLIRLHRPIYRCPVCLHRYAVVLGMRIARPAED